MLTDVEIGAMRERASRPVGIGPALANDLTRALDALDAAACAIRNYSDALTQVSEQREAARDLLSTFIRWGDGWCPQHKCCATSYEQIAERARRLLNGEEAE